MFGLHKHTLIGVSQSLYPVRRRDWYIVFEAKLANKGPRIKKPSPRQYRGAQKDLYLRRDDYFLDDPYAHELRAYVNIDESAPSVDSAIWESCP